MRCDFDFSLHVLSKLELTSEQASEQPALLLQQRRAERLFL